MNKQHILTNTGHSYRWAKIQIHIYSPKTEAIWVKMHFPLTQVILWVKDNFEQ